MSQLPKETLDTLRSYNDISVDIYGFDCDLFVPNNLNANENDDVYKVATDNNYTGVKTKVFVEWTPNIHKLRKMGIYADEGSLPILGWFKELPEVKRGTFVRFREGLVPIHYGTADFEVVDIEIRAMYDSAVLQVYKLVPTRRK